MNNFPKQTPPRAKLMKNKSLSNNDIVEEHTVKNLSEAIKTPIEHSVVSSTKRNRPKLNIEVVQMSDKNGSYGDNYTSSKYHSNSSVVQKLYGDHENFSTFDYNIKNFNKNNNQLQLNGQRNLYPLRKSETIGADDIMANNIGSHSRFKSSRDQNKINSSLNQQKRQQKPPQNPFNQRGGRHPGMISPQNMNKRATSNLNDIMKINKNFGSFQNNNAGYFDQQNSISQRNMANKDENGIYSSSNGNYGFLGYNELLNGDGLPMAGGISSRLNHLIGDEYSQYAFTSRRGTDKTQGNHAQSQSNKSQILRSQTSGHHYYRESPNIKKQAGNTYSASNLNEAASNIIPEITQEKQIQNVRNFRAFLKDTKKQKFQSSKDVKPFVKQKSIFLQDSTINDNQEDKFFIHENGVYQNKTRITMKSKKLNYGSRKSMAVIDGKISIQKNERKNEFKSSLKRKNNLQIIQAKADGDKDQEDENQESQDITDEDEQIRLFGQVRKSRFLISPDSQVRQLVDFGSFFIVIFISLYVPFTFAFNVDTNIVLTTFEIIIDSWFLLEIFLNFFTGFYDKGVLILDGQKIFKNYMHGWFFMDLISSIPVSYMDLIFSDGTGAFQQAKLLRIFKLTKYARLLRLIRFLKVSKFIQTFEDLVVNDYANLMIRFSKISIIVFFIAHWMACCLYIVGTNELETIGYNWLSLQGLQDVDVMEAYINSLYWSFTTMCTVGYGDFHPNTTYERMTSMVIMILSSGIFAFIIGDIGRIVSGFNGLAAQFRESMIYVDKFLKQKQIPNQLRSQVKRYLEYNWELKKLYKIEEKELMDLLNDNLKGKITIYLNGQILQNIDILCQFPIEFLSNLTFIFQKTTFTIDENVCIEGEPGQEIYFLVTGRVNLIHRRSKSLICELDKDKYFGEISFFTQLTRQVTVKTKDFTDVLYIKRDSFLQMASKVSIESLILYNKIKDSVTYNEKDFKLLALKCYVCDGEGHISIHCKKFFKLKGNLKRKSNLQKNYSNHSDSIHMSDINYQDKDNPKLVSLASRSNSLSISKSKYNENSFSNLVMMNQDLVETSSEESMKTEDDIILEEDEEEIKDDSHQNIGDKQLYKKQTRNSQKSPSKLSKLTGYKPQTPISTNLDLQEEQVIQFDTPPKNGSPNLDFTHYQQSQLAPLQKQRQQLINNLVIQEAVQEDEEDKEQITNDDKNDELNLSYQSSGNELDESQPFLKQNKQIKFIKPPKAQNELTKLIGQRKRFGSKVHRETQKESEKYSQEKEEMQNTQTMRRSIQIMPFKEIKKKIETHKSETNRNIIKNQTQRLQQKQTQKMNVNLNQTQSYLNSSLHSAYKNDQKFRTQKLSSSKIQDLSNEEGNKKNPNQISLSREQEQLQITTESVSFRNPTKKLSEDSFFIGLMQENNQDLDQSLKEGKGIDNYDYHNTYKVNAKKGNQLLNIKSRIDSFELNKFDQDFEREFNDRDSFKTSSNNSESVQGLKEMAKLSEIKQIYKQLPEIKIQKHESYRRNQTNDNHQEQQRHSRFQPQNHQQQQQEETKDYHNDVPKGSTITNNHFTFLEVHNYINQTLPYNINTKFENKPPSYYKNVGGNQGMMDSFDEFINTSQYIEHINLQKEHSLTPNIFKQQNQNEQQQNVLRIPSIILQQQTSDQTNINQKGVAQANNGIDGDLNFELKHQHTLKLEPFDDYLGIITNTNNSPSKKSSNNSENRYMINVRQNSNHSNADQQANIDDNNNLNLITTNSYNKSKQNQI
eukprot:403346469